MEPRRDKRGRGRGRGRYTLQRPVAELSRISIVDRLTQFKSSNEPG